MLFDRVDQDPYKSYIGSPFNWGGTELGSDPSAVIDHPGFITARTSDVNVQQDARKITWTSIGQFYLQSPEADLRPYLNANSALEFDTIVSQASQGSFVTLSMHCTYPCRVDVPGKALFDGLAGLGKQHVKIPLACFDAPGTLEWDHVNTPFLVYTEAPFEAAFANVRLVPGAGDDADAIPCSALT